MLDREVERVNNIVQYQSRVRSNLVPNNSVLVPDHCMSSSTSAVLCHVLHEAHMHTDMRWHVSVHAAVPALSWSHGTLVAGHASCRQTCITQT